MCVFSCFSSSICQLLHVLFAIRFGSFLINRVVTLINWWSVDFKLSAWYNVLTQEILSSEWICGEDGWLVSDLSMKWNKKQYKVAMRTQYRQSQTANLVNTFNKPPLKVLESLGLPMKHQCYVDIKYQCNR